LSTETNSINNANREARQTTMESKHLNHKHNQEWLKYTARNSLCLSIHANSQCTIAHVCNRLINLQLVRTQFVECIQLESGISETQQIHNMTHSTTINKLSNIVVSLTQTLLR
jgi:hypothetical protein